MADAPRVLLSKFPQTPWKQCSTLEHSSVAEALGEWFAFSLGMNDVQVTPAADCCSFYWVALPWPIFP